MGSKVTLDANEAVAHVAYQASEVCAIYPITPSSPMGEWADQWMSEGRPNIWGSVPDVAEMQSEGGASGAMHGVVQAGALASTFTASQGLLLMIPNMFKIAGELTPLAMHVSARTVATHALSIFGDHSDVMATRSTGFALLASNSVQEAMDMACIAHAATLASRIPTLHFFDGFRSSHEVQKVDEVTAEQIRAMIDDELVRGHRQRALSPDHPFIRGTAQNPDVFFQARETCNPYYFAAPEIFQNVMDRYAEVTGRAYKLFDYLGAPDAERVVVLMGSGAEAAQEAVERLVSEGEKVGMIKVRLYRPFSLEAFLNALPPTVKSIAALDRTKEPGAAGEPLYQDIITACLEGLSAGKAPFESMPRIVSGRYGLSSKEFTPAMVKAVLDNLTAETPRNHFTVGIVDDVTHLSLDYDPEWTVAAQGTIQAVFYGLGSDGTVGANKNSIKIIGEETDNYTQGYFVYDSKKSGSVTVSHLRFGPQPIHSTYLVDRASFVACHQFPFLERLNVLEKAAKGATFLLNSPYGPDEVWDHIPKETQKQIIEKQLKFYVIDGVKVAKDAGMGHRINTVMQTCFFAISGILPRDEAIAAIKRAIKKTYGRRGEKIVQKNYDAVDAALQFLYEVKVPEKVTSTFERKPPISPDAPEFVRNVLGPILVGEGDKLPVSLMPNDGTFPLTTARWEKRAISQTVPAWDPDVCIQCGKCVLVCPHAVLRSKLYDPECLKNAPGAFKSAKARFPGYKDMLFTIQVSAEDCTGCNVCVESCPAKNKQEAGKKAINMEAFEPLRESEWENWQFFEKLPEFERGKLDRTRVKDVQLYEPLFEFSGACAGCGETPYVKLMTQLFGDRAIIANATGCSSIYGGNLPTTPFAANKDGRGPAWSNSLFEDNAEFGFGMRLAIDKQRDFAEELVKKLESKLGGQLVTAILEADQTEESGIKEQRERVEELKKKLQGDSSPEAQNLLVIADMLVKKSVWILGGDGWAYDIGYGGLDHVLASDRDINVLVLDTEVYSNTGGQSSKATPRGAVAKFAAGGKPLGKKDLGLLAMAYQTVYVAQIAMGSNDAHTVKAFVEAESYPGPSLIIAYSHCIAHGFDLTHGLSQQKNAVQAGHWPLYRFDPRLAEQGKNRLQLDSRAPKIPFESYAYNETRYAMLKISKPDDAAKLLKLAQQDANARWKLYEHLAQMPSEAPGGNGNG